MFVLFFHELATTTKTLDAEKKIPGDTIGIVLLAHKPC